MHGSANMTSLLSGHAGTHTGISSPQAIYQRMVVKRARAATEEGGAVYSSFDGELTDPRAMVGIGLGIAASPHVNEMVAATGPEPKRRRGDPTEGGWRHPGLTAVATGGGGMTTVPATADLEDENAMELS
ncbi:hypothetical protein BGZ73_005843 [Actinomortierella ambigua]|nr:hypothetical protein BGZ73_005843 [Actinomortierella ambigua]